MRTQFQAQRERGIAVIMALVLISFMLVLVVANTNALYQLRREIKLTDQRQRLHWAELATATNAPAAKEAK